ncbi:MAG: SRPBCC domain-containing protein [Gemmatimonadota bacterium]|jgi:uncharacterized protein YndB with AHSA1/START domain
MADILHWIEVEAPPAAVFEALTTEPGLSAWWTADVEALPVEGSVAVFGFNDRAVVFRMRIDELTPNERVRWTCLGDFDEWKGTRLEFALSPATDGTAIHFSHRGWDSIEGFYRQCNTDWGRLMYYLKDHLEGGRDGPMMA